MRLDQERERDEAIQAGTLVGGPSVELPLPVLPYVCRFQDGKLKLR